MNEPQQAKFEGWAIVELFGHQREAGFVTTEYFGAWCLFRIDVPELPAREYILDKPDWSRDLEIGTKVRRESVPARSRIVGPGAVYGLNPCTEEAARKAIENIIPRELVVLELPKKPKLPAGDPTAADFIDDDSTDDLDETLDDLRL